MYRYYKGYKIYYSDLHKLWVVCTPGTSFIVHGAATLSDARAFVDRHIAS